MHIDYAKFQVEEYEEVFLPFKRKLLSKPGSEFETLYMTGGENQAIDRGMRAAKQGRFKYFCSYLCFEPAITTDWVAIRKMAPFMQDYLDFDLHDINFSPVIQEAYQSDVGVSDKAWHVFILEVALRRERLSFKAERFCMPRITPKRLEVLERMLEIHCQDGLRSGQYDDYVIRELESMHYYEEANMVARLR